MLVLTSPPFINEELGAQTVKTLAQGHMASRSWDLNPGRLASQVTRSTTELQGLPSLALREPQVSSAFTPLTPPRILSPVYRALLGALSGPCLGRPSLQASLCVLLSPGLSSAAALVALAGRAPLLRLSPFLAQTCFSPGSSSLPVRWIARLPSICAERFPFVCSHCARLWGQSREQDREKSPSGAHMCVRVCVNPTTVKYVHLLECYGHVRRPLTALLLRQGSWEGSEQGGLCPLAAWGEHL